MTDTHGLFRNSGGEKISPLEVDSALLSVPGVGEAVSFGVPDKMYGEVVWACIVPKAEAKGKITEKEIISQVATKLAKVSAIIQNQRARRTGNADVNPAFSMI